MDNFSIADLASPDLARMLLSLICILVSYKLHSLHKPEHPALFSILGTRWDTRWTISPSPTSPAQTSPACFSLLFASSCPINYTHTTQAGTSCSFLDRRYPVGHPKDNFSIADLASPDLARMLISLICILVSQKLHSHYTSRAQLVSRS